MLPVEYVGRQSLLCVGRVHSLHHKAGSNPIELHGTTHNVVCLECGKITSRHGFQERLKELNMEVDALPEGNTCCDLVCMLVA